VSQNVPGGCVSEQRGRAEVLTSTSGWIFNRRTIW
jgi:hypothetical protein